LCIASLSLFSIDGEVLLRFGAKEPILLVQGEYWRLLTPVFLHAGLFHFMFNNLALKAIGKYMETFLGWKIFLLLYLLAGLGGSLAGSFFSLSMSTGASGAIFGLIGVGVVVENTLLYQGKLPPARSISEYFRVCPFSFLSVLNLAIAVIFNLGATTLEWHTFMDNAAHLGGLASGILLTLAYLHLARTPLYGKSWVKALAFFALWTGLAGYTASQVLSKEVLQSRFFADAQADEDPRDQYYDYSRVLRLDPLNSTARFARGKLLFLHGEGKKALEDFLYVAKLGGEWETAFMELAHTLRKQGEKEKAHWIEEFYRSQQAATQQL